MIIHAKYRNYEVLERLSAKDDLELVQLFTSEGAGEHQAVVVV
jgi:hypothetical protein